MDPSQRLKLQELFEEITDHVYFQPPNNFRMQFPCITYEVDGANQQHADNKSYRRTTRYQVTVIDPNPDSELPGEVIELPMCEFIRSFQADELNHYVFNLFF